MRTPDWHRFSDDQLILKIRVQPRASRGEIVGVQAGRLKIRLTAAPVENAVNAQLRKLLGREFGVPQSRVRVLSGETGRDKRIAIDHPARLPGWLGIERAR